MITLLTDFGTADYFVPAVKGVILSFHPQTQIIDLTHDIPAQDVAAAAFTLGACYHHFPAGTIHLAVVDPGVGSARRALVVAAGGAYFVGPDNGIFSFVYARETDVRVFAASDASYFRPSISPTFHGRDMFAPLAAWLSKGVVPSALGQEIDDPVKLAWAVPQRREDVIRGEILHVDHFGNCITNLTSKDWDLSHCTTSTRFVVGGTKIRQFGTHFADAQNRAEGFAYLGSAGYWELAWWQASAAQKLAAQRGTAVQLFC